MLFSSKRRIRHLWRYSQPLLKMEILVIPFLLGFLIYFFWYLLPLVSATSIQAGLTLVAEIVGVILGAILVVIGFLSDRLHQAETLLLESFPKYRNKIEVEIDSIEKIRENLIKGLLETKSRWDAKTLADIKKCISAQSQISFMYGAVNREHLWLQLDMLDFSQNEIDEDTSIHLILAELPPNRFFRVLNDALDYSGIPAGLGRYSPKLEEYWVWAQTEMAQDGIITALERYEFSHNLLNSWILAITIITSIVTLLISVFTIFSVTEITFNYPSVMLWTYISLIGFLVSIFLLWLSLRRLIVG